MYSGFLRYSQLTDDKLKEKTLPVLTYSINRNFMKILNKSRDINNFLDEDSRENYKKLINSINPKNYDCDIVLLKKSICEEFYKNGKYYLD